MTEQKKASNLSTFAGVFTPNILTILGVIMFLRMGYVVGNAGLIQALQILLLANLVSITTSFSLSAITTNMTNVGGGGDYFLISRSIGVGYGGAIGIILYFAQTISVALYIIGFSDALISVLPFLAPWGKLISLGMLGLLFFPTYQGADLASKVQMFILVILALSITAFVGSSIFKFETTQLVMNLRPEFMNGNSFWVMFALFFPAVTGFTQGVSLSGTLKNPQKSIPLGTFLAVIIGFAIYALMMVLLAGSSSRALLHTNYNVMSVVTIIPGIITLGVFSATISSALGSFMGAPQLIQAVGKDKLLPFIHFFAKGYPQNNNPRRGVVLTAIIAAICILLADLNTLAPIIAMFFLISYGMTNYATFIESYSQNPSFRPRFRFNHWGVSLFGLLCIGFFMLRIDPVIAVISFGILFALQTYFQRRIKGKRFKDARSGFYFQRAKEYLIKLQNQPVEEKNWRPQVLLLCGKPKDRLDLIEFGTFLESDRGLLSMMWILTTKETDTFPLKSKSEKELRLFQDEYKIDFLGDVVVTRDFIQSVETLLQCYGYAGLRHNTLLVGWSDAHGEQKKNYIEMLRFAYSYGNNIVIYNKNDSSNFQPQTSNLKPYIDIWWRGSGNGALMLMYAFLLQESLAKDKLKIRVMRMINDSADRKSSEKQLKDLIEVARIEGEVVVLEKDEKNVCDVILEASQKSRYVFMGLAVDIERNTIENNYLEKYDNYREAFANLVIIKSKETKKILE